MLILFLFGLIVILTILIIIKNPKKNTSISKIKNTTTYIPKSSTTYIPKSSTTTYIPKITTSSPPETYKPIKYDDIIGTNIYKRALWAFPEIKSDDIELYVPGLCPKDFIKNKDTNVNYISLISKKYKQPLCTIWSGKKDPKLDPVEKKPQFNTCCETDISPYDLSGTGFSKGHQVADADMGLFSCEERSCAYGTFTMCNVSPQNERLNGEIWAHIEEGSRKCSKKLSVVVYTGPLFLKDKYWCTKQGNCVNKDCDKFLSPTLKNGGDLDWYIKQQYYTNCDQNKDGIPVPDAYYKFMSINEEPYITYAIIISQRNPENLVENASILSQGKEAFDITNIFLEKNGIILPEILSKNIIEMDKKMIKNWTNEKCPF